MIDIKIFAALGMAVSYYTYPFIISASGGQLIILLVIIVFIVLIGLIRTLSSLPNKKLSVLLKLSMFITAAALGFSLGIALRRNIQSNVELGLKPEMVSAVSGILRDDPRSLQGGGGFGVIELYECSSTSGIRASAKGNLSVFFKAESIPRLKEFGRGSGIYTEGRLVFGERGPLFNAASVHIVKPAPPLETFRTGMRLFLLDRFKNRQDRKYTSLEEPIWSGLASALLLGVRDDLDVDLSKGFINSGCAHVLALSGMHLAIISSLLAFLLRKPFGLRIASLIGALFIISYVFIVGSQPSLVRAAIMYLIGCFAVWGLLKRESLSLLCMAFIIQLLIQGESGVSLSFILSYLALFGILTLGQDLSELLKGRLPSLLNKSISVSLAAFIVTAPVVTLYFGILRPIGIIASLLVAPISSVFIIFALAALVSGFLPFPLWFVLDLILSFIYRILNFLVSAAGRIPGIQISNSFAVLIFSILFWLLVLFLKRKDSQYRNSIASFD
jgi:competence protein ComEC